MEGEGAKFTYERREEGRGRGADIVLIGKVPPRRGEVRIRSKEGLLRRRRRKRSRNIFENRRYIGLSVESELERERKGIIMERFFEMHNLDLCFLISKQSR